MRLYADFVCLQKLFCCGSLCSFTLLVDNSLQANCELGKRGHHAAHKFCNEDGLCGDLCECVNTCNVEDLTIDVTTLDLKGFDLVCILLEDLCGSNCVVVGNCDCGHSFEYVCEVAVAGIFACSLGDRVLVNLVVNVCLTKCNTKCGIVSNGDSLIVYENAGSGTWLEGQRFGANVSEKELEDWINSME